jgi:hypothetical protein
MKGSRDYFCGVAGLALTVFAAGMAAPTALHRTCT